MLSKVTYRMMFLCLAAAVLAACMPAAPASDLPAATEFATIAAPGMAEEPNSAPYESPDWFRSATLYLIYVRSFADSDGDGIGDLNGVAEKLDYLQSLSVDTLWLMPIYPSPSVHGYDVIDFMAVNPEYGTLEDLQSLVAAAHARSMRILLDFVPSHLSSQNTIFQDAYSHPDSPYNEWFVWTNDAHTTYASFADLKEMPRFNHFNPQVVDYLSETALYWLDLDGDGDYRDGIDGFRVDNATFPPQEFFYTLRARIKEVNPEALLLGETWVTNSSDLSRYFNNQFDALFDFPLYALLQGNQNFNGDGLLAGESSPTLLTVLLQDEARYFPEEGIPVRFANNHDTNRIATEVDGNMGRERLVPALIGFLHGVPVIYYGEEIGMFGQKGGPPAWDNYRREPMDWYAAETGPDHTTWFQPDDRSNQPADGISVEEQEDAPESLLNFYRHVYQLRRQYPAITQGELQVLDLQAEAAGPWGVLRKAGSDQLVGLFNFSDQQQTVTIKDFPFSSPQLIDLLTDQEYGTVEKGARFMIVLPAAGAVWLGP